MSLFRSILLIFALLAQALPVAALGRGAEMETCSMSCCVTVQKLQAVVDCGCLEAPASTPTRSPANPAPASSRDLPLQPQWVLLDGPLHLTAATSLRERIPAPRLHGEAPALTQPHVRLPVLFCSFLT